MNNMGIVSISCKDRVGLVSATAGILFDLGANIMQIGVKNPADPTQDTFHTYTLTGAIPTSIGAVEVSHETTDALLTFDVTIQYSYHTFA